MRGTLRNALLVLASVLGLVAGASAYADDEAQVRALVSLLEPAQRGAAGDPGSSGTGFIIHTNGFILSNAHVVAGADRLEVVLHDGSVHEARVIESDEYKDLALLKIEASGLASAPLGDSGQVEVTDPIMTVGYPLGTILGSSASVYEGKVNAIRDEERVPKFQISATVNSGNSGGPLVNDRGEVIGVVVAKVKTEVAEGIGFAIPLREAKSLLRHAYPYGVPTSKATDKLGAKEIFRRLKPATVLVLNFRGGGDTDIAGLAGKSVLIELPGLPSGAKKLELVLLVPGQFTMGSLASEPNRKSDEGPQTRVTLALPFFMGRYEVTQGQWEAIMGSNPSNFKGDPDLPVEKVSWEDAMVFCRKVAEGARKLKGFELRLPTEAQWEYACRAGATTATAYGDSLSSTQANFDGKNPYNGGAVGPCLDRTTKVGSYAPNGWGLYDMHGNVWEWCLDWYGPAYPGGSVTDPKGPSSGSFRVFRGGGWSGVGQVCRSAFRNGGGPSGGSNAGGFRAALVSVP